MRNAASTALRSLHSVVLKMLAERPEEDDVLYDAIERVGRELSPLDALCLSIPFQIEVGAGPRQPAGAVLAALRYDINHGIMGPGEIDAAVIVVRRIETMLTAFGGEA